MTTAQSTFTDALNASSTLGNAIQAEFLKRYTSYLAQEVKKTIKKPDDDSMDPVAVVDILADSAQSVGADAALVAELRTLKGDQGVLDALTAFTNEMSGTGSGDLTKKQSVLPSFDTAVKSKMEKSLTGKDGKFTSLWNTVDYISGTGATNRAIDSGPGLLHRGPSSIMNLMLRDHSRATERINRGKGRLALHGLTNTFFKDVAAQDQAQLDSRYASRVKAKGILDKVGKGTKIYGQLGGVVGGIDTLQSGARSKDDRVIASGAFGVASALYSITDSVTEAIVKKTGASTDVAQFFSKSIAASNVKNVGWKTSTKLTKSAARFAVGIGSALAIGAGVASVVKNAKKADAARQSGNHGRAAVYGVMAAIDSVDTVLNVVSLVADFVPGIGTLISAVADVIGFALNMVNMALEFIAELVDTRSPEQKLQAEFDSYVDSDAFKKFITDQGEFYKKQGFDVFQYITDPEAAGIKQSGADGTAISKTITRELSKQAEKNNSDENLRLALIDASSLGRTLTGRENDDYISGGKGDDIIYGKGGNDVIFGGEGNDTLHLGSGNDNASGGTGNDKIIAGSGDDVVRGGLGADSIDLGPGNDTVVGLLGDDKIDGGSGNDTVRAEEIFDNIQRKDYSPDWKNLDAGQIETAAFNAKNWEAYKPASEPALGYKIDLQTEKGSVIPAATPVGDIPNGGLYNWSLFPKLSEFGDPVDRNYRSHFFINSLPAISVLDKIKTGTSGYQLATMYEDLNGFARKFSTYKSRARDASWLDSGIKTAYDSFLASAKADGREVYLLGESNTTIVKREEGVAFGNKFENIIYPMLVLTDGREIMLFDPAMGYVKLNNADLVAMVGGASGNFKSAAGYYLYLLEKIGLNAELKNLENAVGTVHDDQLYGNEKTNQLYGDAGDDKLYGRKGHDLLDGSKSGSNLIDGGEGNDTASYSVHGQGVTASLLTNKVAKGNGTDTLVSIENIAGTDHNDTLTGDDNGNRLLGKKGVDTIDGGKGNDFIDGGAGADTLIGGEGNDTVSYGSSTTSVTVNLNDQSNNAGDTLSGFESVLGGSAADHLIGNSQTNSLIGGDGADVLEGKAGNDTLIGGKGNDTLKGGADNDRLSGGEGVDSLDGGDGADTLDFSLSGHDSELSLHVDLQDNKAYSVAANGAKTLLDNFSNMEAIVGGDKDDYLLGDNNANSLEGGKGNDTLSGRGGNDILVARDGIDQLSGGADKDIYQVIYSKDSKAIVDDSDYANALLIQGITLKNLGVRFANRQLELFDKRNGKTVLEDRASQREIANWSGEATAEQTVQLIASFVKRFSTLRVNNTVYSDKQTAEWMGDQLVAVSGGTVGNELSNLINITSAVSSVNGAGGNDRIFVKKGTATVTTGKGNDYVDFTGNVEIKQNAATVIVQDFDVIEVEAGAKLVVSKSNAAAKYGLVIRGELNDWNIDADGTSLLHKDGAKLQLPAKPDSIIFKTAATGHILVKDMTAYYAARAAGNPFTHRWELTANGGSVLNFSDTNASDVKIETYTNGVTQKVRVIVSGKTYADSVLVVEAGESVGSAVAKLIVGIKTADGYKEGDSLAQMVTQARSIVGTDAGEVLVGTASADSILGAGGDDTLNAGAGNDVLNGGLGNNILRGEAGIDTAVYTGAASLSGLEVDLSQNKASFFDANASTNLLSNGDFESGTTWHTGAGTANGWTYSNGYEIYQASVYGRSNTGHNRVAEMDVSGNTTLSQTIKNLQVGDRLALSFDAAMRTAYVTAQDGIRVYWNDQVISELTNMGDWKNHSLTLTAIAGDNVLKFEGIGPSSSTGAILDNVSVVKSFKDTLSSIENATGSDFADKLFGDTHTNRLSGGKGDDILDGRGGSDTLSGGADNDRLDVSGVQVFKSSQADLLASHIVTIDGGEGQDTFSVSAQGLTYRPGAWWASETTYHYVNPATVNTGVDYVYEARVLNHNYTIDLAKGTADYNYQRNFRTKKANGSLLYQIEWENLRIANLENVENAVGSSLNDTLIGNGQNNLLIGGKGNDTLTGGAGNDTYQFSRGDGQDSITDTNGTDKVSYKTGTASDISKDDLWFKKSGDDLEILVKANAGAATDKQTVKGYYTGSKVEEITAGGKTLSQANIESLVSIMSSKGDFNYSATTGTGATVQAEVNRLWITATS